MANQRDLEGAVPHVLHMSAGDDIVAGLKRFFIDGGWTELVIMGCAGSMEKAVVCYPQEATLPPVVERIEMDGAFEICTITGNVIYDNGAPRVHLHGSFAENGTKVFGGAIREGSRIFKSADFFLLAYK
jgi:predicted DNA-binding protein with PD1-like motif